jgi:hypothetical protein
VQVWSFITGDPDVTESVSLAMLNAVLATGAPPISTQAVDDPRWDHAVHTFVGAQQGESEKLSYHLAYAEVDAVTYAAEEIHTGQLELKEPGFLSSSWRLQYFVLRGKTLLQCNDKPPPAGAGAQLKATRTWAISEDPSFFCRVVEDAERADCLEIGNAAGSITVRADVLALPLTRRRRRRRRRRRGRRRRRRRRGGGGSFPISVQLSSLSAWHMFVNLSFSIAVAPFLHFFAALNTAAGGGPRAARHGCVESVSDGKRGRGDWHCGATEAQ